MQTVCLRKLFTQSSTTRSSLSRQANAWHHNQPRITLGCGVDRAGALDGEGMLDPSPGGPRCGSGVAGAGVAAASTLKRAPAVGGAAGRGDRPDADGVRQRLGRRVRLELCMTPRGAPVTSAKPEFSAAERYTFRIRRAPCRERRPRRRRTRCRPPPSWPLIPTL